MNCRYVVTIVLLLAITVVNAQHIIRGEVRSSGEPVEYASVVLDGEVVVQTDTDGKFVLESVSAGTHEIKVSYVGYKTVDRLSDV